jgi:hypothetical protein
MAKRKINKDNLNLSGIERPSQEEYQKLFKLKFNPFPSTPISWEEEFFSPLNPQHKDELEEFVDMTFGGQEFGALSIIGDYGSGKSHILKYLHSQINSQLGGVGTEKAVSILLISPPASTMNIVYETFRSIGRSRLTKFLWHVFFQAALNIDDRAGITGEKIEEVKKEIADKYYDVAYSVNYREFLEDFPETFPNLQNALKEYIQNIIGQYFHNKDFCQELTLLILTNNEYESVQSWDIISGVDLERSIKLERRFSAEEQFSSLLRFLYDIGYSHVYLLIDEFADINPPSRNQTLNRDYVVDLNGLVRTNVDFLSLVITLPEQAWMQLKHQMPSFTRMFNNMIRILPLNNAQARRLVKKYLSRARSDGKLSAAPFTTGAIDELNDLAGGNVRAFLSFCSLTLTMAVQGEISSISKMFVSESFYGGQDE